MERWVRGGKERVRSTLFGFFRNEDEKEREKYIPTLLSRGGGK